MKFEIKVPTDRNILQIGNPELNILQSGNPELRKYAYFLCSLLKAKFLKIPEQR